MISLTKFYSKKYALFILLIIISIIFTGCTDENFIGKAYQTGSSVGNLKYYGYYTWDGYGSTKGGSDVITSFTNFKYISYSPSYTSQTLNASIVNAENSGFKIILSINGYFYYNLNKSDSEWRTYLTDLKTKLGTNTDKIWALYLFDEPDGIFKENSTNVNRVINLTKEIFPNTNTMVIFFTPWIQGKDILNNKNLDLIGTDPYFMSYGVEKSMVAQGLDPYACGPKQQKAFNNTVQSRIYWIKSGGNSIQYACWDNENHKSTWPDGCTQQELNNINTILNSDTNKKIIMVGQDFKCNQYVQPWNITELPSACQQKWYFDLAKKDPDIIGFMWYIVTPSTYLTTYENKTAHGKGDCIGAGNYTPDIFLEHKNWGLEVLCSNTVESDPFCASNGVSYKNADQAKCKEQTVIHPGGAGKELCDSSCGADASCNGKAPGTNNCTVSCKYTECTSSSQCNDNNNCTTDTCTNYRCVYTNNTNTCDDNKWCTINDKCLGGACTGTPVICNDNISCTTDTCNENTDSCIFNSSGCGCTIGSNVSCYNGTQGTLNVGLCHNGTKICSAGVWGSCVGQVLPVAEICDGKDNDCDGAIDETFTNKGNACSVGIGACQRTGKYVCNTQGTNTTCNATAGNGCFIRAVYKGDAGGAQNSAKDVIYSTKIHNAEVENYLVRNSTDSFENLIKLLNESKNTDIKIWATLYNPAEYGGSYPYFTNYTKWASELAKLSLTYPNLEAFAIDDFSHRYSIFTPNYLQQMKVAADKFNPNLKFVPVIYYSGFAGVAAANFNNRKEYFDAVQFYYRAESSGTLHFDPFSSTMFLTELNKLKSLYDKDILIGVYAKRHSTIGFSSTDFVSGLTNMAGQYADGVMIYWQDAHECGETNGTYTTYENRAKLDVIKNFFGKKICNKNNICEAGENYKNCQNDCPDSFEQFPSSSTASSEYPKWNATNVVDYGGKEQCEVNGETDFPSPSFRCGGYLNDQKVSEWKKKTIDETATITLTYPSLVNASSIEITGNDVFITKIEAENSNGGWETIWTGSAYDDYCFLKISFTKKVFTKTIRITTGPGKWSSIAAVKIIGQKITCNATTETCNGLDDDCDGAIDETFTNKGTTCSVGIGACKRTGTYVCNAQGTNTTCNATAGSPTNEICNGLDDNCNGVVDENLSQSCYTGPSGTLNVGICHNGSSVCSAGSWGSCIGQVIPANEICNDLDDDCDGTVDEGCSCVAGAQRSCGSNVGECRNGTQTCNATGQWGSCVGSVGPIPEQCNNKDDNCNGVIDEGLSRLSVNQNGLCSGNKQLCFAGAWINSSANYIPTSEVCDGQDHDCDGIVNTGCNCTNGTTQSCLDSHACAGTQACVNGNWSLCNSTKYFCDVNCDGSLECSDTNCSECNICNETLTCGEYSDCVDGFKTKACTLKNCTSEQEITTQTPCNTGGGGGGSGGSGEYIPTPSNPTAPVVKADNFDIKPDFSSISSSEINDLKIGIAGVGTISFSEKITVPKDKELDLDSAVKISKNKVEIDPRIAPELDKPAEITLYTEGISIPKITKDGVDCSECTIISWDGEKQTLVFSVPHFTTYEAVNSCDDGRCSALENCNNCASDCGSCQNETPTLPEQQEAKPTHPFSWLWMIAELFIIITLLVFVVKEVLPRKEEIKQKIISLRKHHEPKQGPQEQELDNYISNCLQRGYSSEQIVSACKKAGWDENTVKEILINKKFCKK